MVPDYLREITPIKTSERTSYNLRNSQNLSQPITRSTSYQDSFIPSSIKLWNMLPKPIRDAQSVVEFKNNLKKHDSKIPDYYYSGNREGQIILSRMRMQCSPLKNDLYHMHIIDDCSCSCGYHTEDSSHYLFDCPHYDHLRHLFQGIDPGIDHDVVTFLYGSRNVESTSNAKLFAIITKFISKSGRF